MHADEVIFLGMFPPPMTGASKSNQLVFDSLLARGGQASQLNVAAAALSLHRNGLSYHFERSLANLRAWRTLARRKQGTLYVVPDGGLGIIYSWCNLVLAARGFKRIIIHHHTFRYVHSHWTMMQGIVSATRDRACHIFLSQGMADQFQQKYGTVKYLISTNAHHARDAVTQTVALGPKPASPRLRVGHLSNLCREKGFFDVATTFETLIDQGIDAELDLAGPLVNDEVKLRLEELKSRHGERVTHRGPVSGAAKDEFYRGLDLFLFPTRLLEASPIVLYEAFAAGNVALSIRKGCIGEMVIGPRGALCEEEDDFARFTLDFVRSHDWNGPEAQRRSEQITQSLLAEMEDSQARFEKLLDLLQHPDRQIS